MKADAVSMLAGALLLLFYLSAALYFVRNIWRSLSCGYLLAYNERVERSTRPGLFWLFIGLWVAVIVLLAFGAVRSIA
jgi:hypothetical protein